MERGGGGGLRRLHVDPVWEVPAPSTLLTRHHQVSLGDRTTIDYHAVTIAQIHYVIQIASGTPRGAPSALPTPPNDSNPPIKQDREQYPHG